MRTTPLLIALLLAAARLTAQEPPPLVQSGSSFQIRPGDILRVVVWGQEAYSGQFQIDERGMLEYPVIGEIDTHGLTVAQLRDQIRQGLGTIFNSPFVSVSPQFRMAVLGQVRNPSLYTVDPTLSVLDVIALAGGPTPSGNLNGVRLFRAGEQLRLAFDKGEIRGRTLQEIGVRSGDQIVVPRKAFSREDLIIVLQVAQIAASIALLLKAY